ncbi:MAG: M4 family metallopeptidase, partial [Thermoanaerobaculia bacterium]
MDEDRLRTYAVPVSLNMRVPLCSFVPPHVLRALAENGDRADRERAYAALELSSQARGERQAAAVIAGAVRVPPGERRRTIFDARNGVELPGRRMRGEGERATGDLAADEAYDASGRSWDYFRRVHGRASIDDRGMRIDSTVHYAKRFNNAQWNGAQMVYGDGDGKYFNRFTSCVDVVAHELAHGLTQYTARLGMSGQAGALAEHFADVFGILVKQWTKKQRARRGDWLVGRGLFTRRVDGDAIRSMKAPGTAYDDPVLGRDPQPSHMRDLVRTESDNRGVHINSGIPNFAFYTAATLLGGNAWEVAGRVWYDALTMRLGPRARFTTCAVATWEAAG